jgi:hypothetical protein
VYPSAKYTQPAPGTAIALAVRGGHMQYTEFTIEATPYLDNLDNELEKDYHSSQLEADTFWTSLDSWLEAGVAHE